jgi:hypothetical protein
MSEIHVDGIHFGEMDKVRTEHDEQNNTGLDGK